MPAIVHRFIYLIARCHLCCLLSMDYIVPRQPIESLTLMLSVNRHGAP